MVFLVTNQQSGNPQTPFCEKMANKLRNHLIACGKIRENPHVDKSNPIPNWSRDFESILEMATHDEVECVLHWTLENIANRNLPIVRSAKSFRRNFSALRDAMRSDKRSISPNASKILESLSRFEWPPKILDALPSMVEDSLRNYDAFLEKMRRLDSERLPQRLRNFRRHLTESGFLSVPHRFVEHWFLALHGFSGFSNWMGNPSNLIFSERSKWLLEMGQRWAYGYSRRAGDWNDLVERAG